MGQAAAFVGPAVQVLALAASVALQIALAPKGPNEVGPRLNSLRTTSAAYGEDIPIGYGRVRVGSKVIWATDIEEVRFKKSTGGKGSLFAGGGSVTQFKYFGNMALLLAEGPATCITRVWADRKVIYDITGNSEGFFKYPGAAIRCYLGTETQDPDPLIQADKGVDETPAYRGSVYIVLEGLPLEDFGNRLPTIEAEVDFTASPAASEAATTSGRTTVPADARAMKNNRQLYYCQRGGTDVEVGRIDMDSNTLETFDSQTAAVGLYNSEIGGSGFNPEGIFPFEDGKVLMQGTQVGGDRVLAINPWTLTLLDIGELTDFNQGPFQQEASVSFSMKTQQGIKNLTLFITHGQTFASGQTTFSLFDRDEMSTLRVVRFGTGGTNFYLVRCSCIDRDGNIWLVGWDQDMAVDANGRRATLTRVRPKIVADLAEAALGAIVGTVNPIASMLFDPNGIGFDIEVDEFDLALGGIGTTLHHPNYVGYDEPNHQLVIMGTKGATDGKYHFIKLALPDNATGSTFSVVTDRELDDTTDADLEPEALKAAASWQQGPTNGAFVYKSVTDKYYRIRANDLETEEVAAPTDRFDRMWFDRDTNSGFYFPQPAPATPPSRIQYDRCAFSTTPLEDVLEDIETRSLELEPGDLVYDAGILAQDIRGYVQPGRQSVRKLLEPLLFPFNFDISESGYKLKHVTRGGASSRTIAQDDLGARPVQEGDTAPTGGELLKIDRTQEFEIPTTLAFTYFDFDRDQQEGTQYDRRQTDPSPTQEGRDEVAVQAPVLLTADEAAQAAEKGLYQLWVGREQYAYALGPKHMDLDPADIVTVNREGDAFVNRIGRTELGGGFTSAYKAVSEDAELYTSSAVGASVPTTGTLVSLPGATESLVLDISLLQDADDGQQEALGLYVNFGANRSSWRGATMDRSTSGGSGYNEFSVSRGEAPWGFLNDDVAPLPLCPGPGYSDSTEVEYPVELQEWDRITTITVFLVEGGDLLSSITELEALSGDNVMIIGNGDTAEIVSVVDITDNGDGTYDLDTLLRGRRGTEPAAVAGHARGTQVTFVNRAWTNREAIPRNRLDEVDLFRSTSVGQVAEDAVFVARLIQGNDARPYPVAHPRIDTAHDGTTNRTGSTRTVSWTRRTRLGGEVDLDDGFEDVPLGETIEEYDVVLNGKLTSAATAGSGLNILVDSTATFRDGTIAVGDRVRNVTQGIETRIVSITSDTEIRTGSLPGGEVTWVATDSYEIYSESLGVVNTVLAAETTDFTSANFTTANYAPTDLFDISIYQKSAIVGRGRERRVKI